MIAAAGPRPRGGGRKNDPPSRPVAHAEISKVKRSSTTRRPETTRTPASFPCVSQAPRFFFLGASHVLVGVSSTASRVYARTNGVSLDSVILVLGVAAVLRRPEHDLHVHHHVHVHGALPLRTARGLAPRPEGGDDLLENRGENGAKRASGNGAARIEGAGRRRRARNDRSRSTRLFCFFNLWGVIARLARR